MASTIDQASLYSRGKTLETFRHAEQPPRTPANITRRPVALPPMRPIHPDAVKARAALGLDLLDGGVDDDFEPTAAELEAIEDEAA
jgi:hypothetical protein